MIGTIDLNAASWIASSGWIWLTFGVLCLASSLAFSAYLWNRYAWNKTDSLCDAKDEAKFHNTKFENISAWAELSSLHQCNAKPVCVTGFSIEDALLKACNVCS